MSSHVRVPGHWSDSENDDDFFQHVGSMPDHLGMVIGSPMVPLGLPLNRWQRRPSALSLAVSVEGEEDVEAAGNAAGRSTGAVGAAVGSEAAAPLAAVRPDTQAKEDPQPHHQDHHQGTHAAEPDAAVPEEPTSEVGRLLRLAAPLSISNLAGYAISMVVIAATGHLGEAALSVVVLATSVFNVTGLSVLIGFSSAMETFCGQAYGAGRYHLVGLVLQRALLLLTLLAAAVAALWTRAEPILLALGQDPAIAAGTASFLLRATPALWFTGVFEALKRYLMAQEAVRPATVVTVISLCLAPLYNWLLIYKAGLGLYGAAYAMDAMQATLAVLLGAYCVARDRLLAGSPRATWAGLSAKAWSGWGQYCRFALPSVAMLCCEWSTFEVMVLMSGLLPEPQVSVSVMGLCIQTSGLCYMVVTGLACAASVRVSTSLGARQPGAARRATWTAWGLTMVLQAGVGVGIVAVRHQWPRIFTTSEAVVQRTAHLLPLFALSLFGDGTNAVLQGLLRGAGKQETGAVTNLLSYWCCGIPLAAYLAFKRNMGLDGLWWGLVVINTMQGIIMLTITALFNFEKQAEKAAAMLAEAATRTEADGGQDGEGAGLETPLLEGQAPAAQPESSGVAGSKRWVRPRRDAAGVRDRLRESVLLLLTEGGQGPPRRQARRSRRPAASAPVAASMP